MLSDKWKKCPVRLYFFVVLLTSHARPAESVGEEARAGGPGKRNRESQEGWGWKRSDDEGAGLRSSLQAMAAEVERLKALVNSDLQVLVDAFNLHLKKSGYPNLHQKEIREAAAYYMCACRQGSCFLLTFTRPAPSKKGRKEAREWRVKSIGDHLCEPREPRGVAMANTWIPISVKTLLVSLFDQNIGAADAHRQAVQFAAEEELPTTWEKSDVENFFDTIRRLFCSEDIIVQLDALSKAGHFVAVDRKQLPDGRKVLNLAFVAFKSMRNLFRLFGSFGSIDTTYGKNNLQLPVAFFVGTTNEGSIVPFGVCILRSETKENYAWLAQAFYKCYSALPAAIIMDGDKKLRAAVQATALEHHQDVTVLLCVWHLHCDLEKNLLKKTPGVDTFALKKAFYELRGCESQPAFEGKWAEFRKAFGSNPKALKYIDEQLYQQRSLWAQPWTGRAFCGGLQTTGISESLHSLLASGRSAVNTLTDVLVLVDAIVVRQCEKSLDLSAKHEKVLQQFTLESLGGFVVASVSTLLSGHALERLRELNAGSCFFSVQSIDRTDAVAVRSWHVTDLRVVGAGLVHTVSEIPFPVVPNSRRSRVAGDIRRVLSKNVDLGRKMCACCATADETGFESGAGFQLPSRWELLYQGLHERRRLCIALGFNIPKEEGSMNNVTHEGLLDVLKTYAADRDRHLKAGTAEKDAHIAARNAMRVFEYGKRELGVPWYSDGLWVKCGVLDGEEGVPEAERRHYCGLWFHAACVGIVRAPKKADERVQCLQCLQDRRYRVKPPRLELVCKLALWDSSGSPRILRNEVGGRVSTLHLACSCELAAGMGLPCEGMLAVARTCGAVLSFHHFDEHWISGKVIEFDRPEPAFTKNKKLQLNVEAVVEHEGAESVPSHVPDSFKPKRAKVAVPSSGPPLVPTLVVTEGGAVQDSAAGLDGLEAGDAKSDRKKSRRYKSGKSTRKK